MRLLSADALLSKPRVNREFHCHDAHPMKICIVSDSHDRAPMLAAAVTAAKQAGAEAVIHCGDVIGAMTWLVNPGSVGGLGAPATWLLADLASFDFEIQRLD